VLGKFAIAGQLRGERVSQPPVTTSLQTLLGTLPQNLANKIAQKSVRVTIGHDEPFITTNSPLLAYVLSSLIDNAADYSSQNDTIDVQVMSANGRTNITVTDHGPGISPQKMALLFKPFSQTQDVERFTHEGMGFSLYLDKLIATYLDGDISLTSRP